MSNQISQVWAVVPAAGSGSRMNGECPKQYLTLGSQTMLEVTLETLLNYPGFTGVVVAINSGDQTWEKLAVSNHPKVHCVTGGQSRAESVSNALHYLSALEDYADDKIGMWACVHDAARPCVSVEKIDALVQYCLANGKGAILGTPMADTVKRVGADAANQELHYIERTEKREQLWLAHTPQMFM